MQLEEILRSYAKFRQLALASLLLVACAAPERIQRTPQVGEPELPAVDSTTTSPEISSPHVPRVLETQLRERMTRAHERLGRSRPASTTLVWGRLGTGQTQAFNARLSRGICYTVIAACATTDQEVDLTIYDEDGEEVERAVATESTIAVDICPPHESLYRIVVRMYSGSGSYGLQVFGS